MSFLEVIGLVTIAPIVIYGGILMFISAIGIISSVFIGAHNASAQEREKAPATKENL